MIEKIYRALHVSLLNTFFTKFPMKMGVKNDACTEMSSRHF
jgi:hypothetical protein